MFWVTHSLNLSEVEEQEDLSSLLGETHLWREVHSSLFFFYLIQNLWQIFPFHFQSQAEAKVRLTQFNNFYYYCLR